MVQEKVPGYKCSGLCCCRCSDIYANLNEIIEENKLGRENDNEFNYFNSVVLSFLDVALANWMYE